MERISDSRFARDVSRRDPSPRWSDRHPLTGGSMEMQESRYAKTPGTLCRGILEALASRRTTHFFSFGTIWKFPR
jgi:hypothetical protein